MITELQSRYAHLKDRWADMRELGMIPPMPLGLASQLLSLPPDALELIFQRTMKNLECQIGFGNSPAAAFAPGSSFFQACAEGKGAAWVKEYASDLGGRRPTRDTTWVTELFRYAQGSIVDPKQPHDVYDWLSEPSLQQEFIQVQVEKMSHICWLSRLPAEAQLVYWELSSLSFLEQQC